MQFSSKKNKENICLWISLFKLQKRKILGEKILVTVIDLLVKVYFMKSCPVRNFVPYVTNGQIQIKNSNPQFSDLDYIVYIGLFWPENPMMRISELSDQ